MEHGARRPGYVPDLAGRAYSAAGDCETGPDVLVRACGNGKRAAWRIDQYLRGESLNPSEKERFNDFFAKVKVYQKDENLGIAGGRGEDSASNARPRGQEMDVRRDGRRVPGGRGDERGQQVPAVLPHRHGGGIEKAKHGKADIDGKPIETEEGRTILQAAREHGIHIPTLCYHANLLSIGSCRICLVEVEGYENPMVSCRRRPTRAWRCGRGPRRY